MTRATTPADPDRNAPSRARRRPRGWFSRIVGIAFLALSIGFLIEHTFGPLRSEHFLRLAARQDAYRPFAIFAAIAMASFVTFAFWKSRNAEHNKGKFDSVFGSLRFALLLLFAPLMGALVGWMLVTFCVPLIQHQLAAKVTVEIPFTVTGFELGERCRGLTAVNPQFFDDRLCGVERWGPSSNWVGRTIVVTGRQSRYGLTLDRYRMEEMPRAP